MLVPGPELVGTVAAQGHGDFFAGHARKQPGGRHRGVGHGHVHAADDVGQMLGAVLGREHALVMVGVPALGHHAGVAALVVAGLGEADGKGLDGRGRLAGHETGHDGRVDAAGEEDPQGHVADHAAAHGAGEQLVHVGADVGLGATVVLIGRGQVPVTADAQAPVLHQQPVRGRQALGLAVHGVRGGHVFVGQVTHDGLRIEGELQPRHGGQAVELRAEEQAALLQGVEEGLFAEAVTGAEQTAAGSIPEGEGEHAVEALEAVRAPDAVGLEDDLRIGVAAVEAGARLQQFLPEFGKVVDLAVEDDAELAVHVLHGLAAAGKVDDGQAAVPQADGPFLPDAAAVGAAVGDDVGHGPDMGPGVLVQGLAVKTADTGYSAHGISTGRTGGSGRRPPVAGVGEGAPAEDRRGAGKGGLFAFPAGGAAGGSAAADHGRASFRKCPGKEGRGRANFRTGGRVPSPVIPF